MMEIHGYRSIFRFTFRRPRVTPGAVGFGYHQPVLPILIVFIAVSTMPADITALRNLLQDLTRPQPTTPAEA